MNDGPRFYSFHHAIIGRGKTKWNPCLAFILTELERAVLVPGPAIRPRAPHSDLAIFYPLEREAR